MRITETRVGHTVIPINKDHKSIQRVFSGDVIIELQAYELYCLINVTAT